MGYTEHFMGYHTNNWRFLGVYGLSLGLYGLFIIYFTNQWYKLSSNLIDYKLVMLITFDKIIKICNDNGKPS